MKEQNRQGHEFRHRTWILSIIIIVGFIALFSQPSGRAFLERLKPTKLETPTPFPTVALSAEKTKVVRNYVEEIRMIDFDSRDYPTFNDYYQTVYHHLKEIIQPIHDVAVLESLFYECHQRIGELPQRTTDWMSPYREVRCIILSRLGDIATEESVETLVRIFSDETIGFDGEFALCVCSSIVSTGDIAMKYLQNIENQRLGFARRIMEMIQKDWRSCI